MCCIMGGHLLGWRKNVKMLNLIQYGIMLMRWRWVSRRFTPYKLIINLRSLHD